MHSGTNFWSCCGVCPNRAPTLAFAPAPASHLDPVKLAHHRGQLIHRAWPADLHPGVTAKVALEVGQVVGQAASSVRRA